MGRRPIRILIVTDSVVIATGMAETTRLIFTGLSDLFPGDYQIEQIGLNHYYAVCEPKWKIYPTLTTQIAGQTVWDPNDRYGYETFKAVLPLSKPDLVFAFNDPQHLEPLCRLSPRTYKLVLYLNYDGVPFFYHNTGLSLADKIVSMSEFAIKIFRQTHPIVHKSQTEYIYSPSDTDRFSVPSQNERAGVRDCLMPKDIDRAAFVIGWVGRNQWRKQVWILYKIIRYLRTGGYLLCAHCQKVTLLELDPMDQSFVEVTTFRSKGRNICRYCHNDSARDAKPLKDIVLWLHMSQDECESTWPTKGLELTYGLKPGEDVIYTEGLTADKKLPPDQTPLLYKVWDMMLFLSGGEGFGIPVWEAMSSGLPIVYTNYSSHAELVNNAGAGIPVGGVLQPEASNCVWRMVADIPEAIEAILHLYSNPLLRTRYGQKGACYTQRFSVKKQVERWDSIFKSLVD